MKLNRMGRKMKVDCLLYQFHRFMKTVSNYSNQKGIIVHKHYTFLDITGVLVSKERNVSQL